MKIAVGFDRRGSRLRSAVIGELASEGHEILDLGVTRAGAGADYESKAQEVAAALLAGTVERGVLVSRSAVGASFVANRIAGVVAGVGSDTYTAERGAELGVRIVCLDARLSTAFEAAEIVRAFTGASSARIPTASTAAEERRSETVRSD